MLAEFYRVLDARDVDDAALEPRRCGAWTQRGAGAGVATREGQDASPGVAAKVGAASSSWRWREQIGAGADARTRTPETTADDREDVPAPTLFDDWRAA